MGLFDKLKKNKWDDKDPQVRMEGIEELLNSDKKDEDKQKILRGIAENDPDSDIRIMAVQNLDIPRLFEEIILNDPDWKVRMAAVEGLKKDIIYFREEFADEEAYVDHYDVNKEYIDFLEEVGQNDESSEVRDAANKIVNDPYLNKNASDKMQGLQKSDIRKISYTVVDVSKNTERNIVLTQNDNLEYTYEAESVKELLDCCFGGDIITITYDNSSGINNENHMIVDYNVLDKQVPFPNKIPIDGTNFDRIITYENIDAQNFTESASLSESDKAYNQMVIPLVKACLYSKNRMFSVAVGDEIRLSEMDFEGGVPDLSEAMSNLTKDLKFKVKKIEFICRKVNELPKSDNMTLYR
ncbi:HEAT repeat domain-containing protein [Methanobrevibacter sp.]|uniref:HEAT repeat domain-containing protein n=1 Tax=Methanobrevibacter sp. TaxID=66852 RepID=UPI0025D4B1A1|nr:HEAT repeat domain-containing protein [Methanobrevibacter sp.]MBQ2961594.1 HEAT repeat domain-containing protein [Methanobrevibacter sp.]